MKYLLTVLVALWLAACGADTATTAASAALMKKQELEQGKKTLEQAQQSIDQSMAQMQQNLQRADAAAEK